MPIFYLLQNLEDEALRLSKDTEMINSIINENSLDGEWNGFG